MVVITDTSLIIAFLNTMEHKILPLTEAGIKSGGGVYGSGIFMKKDLSVKALGTNHWNESPLIHGETDCIRAFFEIPEKERPRTKETFFLTTHEPCPMCLASITWAGFDNIYIFFTYEETRDLFDSPYDISINEAVWKIRAEGETDEAYARRPLYARENHFWKARYVREMIKALEAGEVKVGLERQVARILAKYAALWEIYKNIPRPPGSGKPDE